MGCVSRETCSSVLVEDFYSQVRDWGVELSDIQLETLSAYARELVTYKKANVIGVQDVDKVLIDHVLDSLSCFLCMPLRQARNLVDVGSGGGLPGLPINIASGRMSATLVEATGKKADFLRYVTEELELSGVEVISSRAEDLGRDVGYRGKYDVATVRAVAGLNTILEYCVPLVKQGGSVIAMKGRLGAEELSVGKRAAEALGAEVAEIIVTPFLNRLPQKNRTLVVVRKTSDTSEKYPRKTGKPKKSPLGIVQK